MNISTRSAMVLAVAVGVALVALSIINALTQERITQARQQLMLENLSAVLPNGPFDQNPIDSLRQHVVPALGVAEPLDVYTAYKAGEPAALVLEVVAIDGYSGQIRLLVGLHPDGSIVAVRTIEHKETPGLGDGIDIRKSEWINQFETTSIASGRSSDWQLKKVRGQFDGLTGATITSSAVVQAIYRALNWYDANRDKVFDVEISHD